MGVGVDFAAGTVGELVVVAIGVVKGKFDNVNIPATGGLPIKLDKIQAAIPNIETVLLSVNVGADVLVSATFGMKDEEAADEMKNAVTDLVTQLKPLAQLAGASNERIKPATDILATVKATSKNKDCTVSGKITNANIGAMINPGN